MPCIIPFNRSYKSCNMCQRYFMLDNAKEYHVIYNPNPQKLKGDYPPHGRDLSGSGLFHGEVSSAPYGITDKLVLGRGWTQFCLSGTVIYSWDVQPCGQLLSSLEKHILFFPPYLWCNSGRGWLNGPAVHSTADWSLALTFYLTLQGGWVLLVAYGSGLIGRVDVA